jgi:hypothetical protein
MNKKYESAREPKECRDLCRRLAIETPYLLQRNDYGMIEVWTMADYDSDPEFTGITFNSTEEAASYALGGGVHFRIRET